MDSGETTPCAREVGTGTAAGTMHGDLMVVPDVKGLVIFGLLTVAEDEVDPSPREF